MITNAAAKKLRVLIKAQADAEREQSFAGSASPEDAEAIREELVIARKYTSEYIDELTARTT